jgi:hypothetical protein
MTNILIYHITDVSNLSNIMNAGGLHSDSTLQSVGVQPSVIGHSHIKQRRMTEIVIPCAGNRFVGEFVPFYFCPRSPMLYTINRGNTGRAVGCQSDIVHLVSTVDIASNLGSVWAYSSGNAGAYVADFYNDPGLSQLDWNIINSSDWGGQFRRDKKSAEFLIHDFYPWESFVQIGCYNANMKQRVENLISGNHHQPTVQVRANWYY